MADEFRSERRGKIASLPWWRGWGPIAGLPVVVLLYFPAEWPRWVFMWTLAFVIYVGCKWLTWRRTPVANTPLWRHLGYLLAWPGLNAVTFLDATHSERVRPPESIEWLAATIKLVIGVLLFWGLARMTPEQYPYIVGWIGMIGTVLLLHFGLFHLLSCGWRYIGVDAQPLMNRPLVAINISEFWGVRWNTAFRDLTHRFLFRPLIPRFGPAGTVLAGFIFSGLVHDLVISVPAGGGCGGPTLFFLIQGIAILVSHCNWGKQFGLRRGITGWLFTLAVLLLPVMLLFHRPFVLNIILPFMKFLGAIE